MIQNKIIYLLTFFSFFQIGCTKPTLPDLSAQQEVIFEGSIKNINLVSIHHDGTVADRINFVIEAPSLESLKSCFERAGWTSSDKLTVFNLSKEVKDILRNETYLGAPFSPLYLFGRAQDLGFEIEVQNTPRQRHHIRLWKSLYQKSNKLIWFGAATFDMSVNWIKLTHNTSPDVDAEESFTSKSFLNAKCSESITELDSKQKNYLVEIK